MMLTPEQQDQLNLQSIIVKTKHKRLILTFCSLKSMLKVRQQHFSAVSHVNVISLMSLISSFTIEY